MNTTNNAPQSSEDLVDSTAQAAHQTVDQLQASAADLAEKFSEKAKEFGDLEYQLVEKVRDCVRDHPIASVLTAVAVGLVVAKLLNADKPSHH